MLVKRNAFVLAVIKTVDVMVGACKEINKWNTRTQSRCLPHPLGGCSTGSSTGLLGARAPPAGSPPEAWLQVSGTSACRLQLWHLEKPVSSGQGQLRHSWLQ